MELFNYFRSSASYRVRIALALKGLDYVYRPVHLAKNEQLGESYAAVSAARLVPLLHDGDEALTQSLAIIEYLDETHPTPPLLPGTPAERARVRALARRLRSAAPSVPAADLALNLRRLSLTGPAATVNLSSEEVDLVKLALESPRGRMSFDDIRGVLNRGENISKAALEIKIVRLRKKIADAGLATRSIASMRNFGYQALFSCTLTED